MQEVARRSVSKTQVEVENGEEEEGVAQMVSVFLFFFPSLQQNIIDGQGSSSFDVQVATGLSKSNTQWSQR